jgi:hypothetical protein
MGTREFALHQAHISKFDSPKSMFLPSNASKSIIYGYVCLTAFQSFSDAAPGYLIKVRKLWKYNLMEHYKRSFTYILGYVFAHAHSP